MSELLASVDLAHCERGPSGPSPEAQERKR